MNESATVTLPGRQLTASLRRIGRAAARVHGAGFFDFHAKGLTISWSGAEEHVEGAGLGSIRVRVKGATMKGIAKLRFDGPVTIAVRDERLYVDSTSVSCVPVSSEVEPLLPAFATPRDLALASYRHTRADLLAAGHEAELDALDARVSRSLDRAAAEFNWLGIERRDLSRWLEQHLDEAANGIRESPQPEPARLIVVGQDRQIQLLPDEAE